MTTTKNIYIDALKFGNKKGGVSFNELKEHLTKLNWDLKDVNYSKYLQYWFYNNFYHPSVFAVFEHGQSHSIFDILHKLTLHDNQYDTDKCPLTAKAYEMLLDYDKLQQMRKDSKRAHWVAIAAIIISIIIGAIQIWQNCKVD